MHVMHRNPEFMGTHNFNLTFPIRDALFGTSNLHKGVLGTLVHLCPADSDFVTGQVLVVDGGSVMH